MARRYAGAVLARATVVGVLLLLGAACERNGGASSQSPAQEPAGDDIVARIGERQIAQAESDAPIAGALHELDYDRYRLRR